MKSLIVMINAMKVFKSGGDLSRDRDWKDFASKNF